MLTIRLIKENQTHSKVHYSEYIVTENTDSDEKPEGPTAKPEEPSTE